MQGLHIARRYGMRILPTYITMNWFDPDYMERMVAEYNRKLGEAFELESREFSLPNTLLSILLSQQLRNFLCSICLRITFIILGGSLQTRCGMHTGISLHPPHLIGNHTTLPHCRHVDLGCESAVHQCVLCHRHSWLFTETTPTNNHTLVPYCTHPQL